MAESRRPQRALRQRGASRALVFGFLPSFALVLLAVLTALPAPAAFVYETPSEFITSGDFNGDGLADALVLDKITGNARIGYQNVSGALVWSPARSTGTERVNALAVGRFSQTNSEAIAVTAAELNRIHVLNLSNPSNAPTPAVVNSAHASLSLLVGLDAPLGVSASRSWMATGTHDPGVTLLDLFAFIGDSLSSFQDQIADQGYLSSGSSFRRFAGDATLLAAIRRGSNDAFLAYAYSNTAAPVLVRSNLPPRTEYVFGTFNGEPYPRLLFYVPGQSNVIVQPLTNGVAGFGFGAATINTFASPVRRVYFVDEQTNGLVVIHFGDGVAGLRLPGGSGGHLQASYSFGLGPAGNDISGLVPLGFGKFALLSSASNSPASTLAQIYTKTGSNYNVTSSSALPAVTSAGTRGNVWLFQIEPFVSSAATLVGSLSAPAWSSSILGFPGTISVRVESDGGTTTGLGSPATNNFGAPPAGTAYVLPNQYREDISFFGYAPARAPEPSVITIAPPPGAYSGPIQISFIKQNATHSVYYRKGPDASWQLYAAPFALTNDATIEYYGQTPANARGRTQTASYALGNIAVPAEPLVTLPGSDTNAPTVVNPGIPTLSTVGTVFYGRRGNNTLPSIWTINLDGSGELRVTTGREPRVSRDGRWLTFWRENDPATNQFSLWLRNVSTGQESRWHTRSNRFIGYDWRIGNTNLIFAADGSFWRIGLNEAPVVYPLPNDTRQGAPSVHPVDGRVALQVIYPGSLGLYLAPSNVTSRQNLSLNILSPRWPAWSPGGGEIAVADDPNISPVLDAGRNLWVVKPGSPTTVYQITTFPNGSNGFPNGAVWSPDGTRLVSAGRMGGVNGLWVVPLTPNRDACASTPIRLPTSAGDDIDFAGSVVAASTAASYLNLGLFIRFEQNAVVVYWTTNYDGFALESALAMPASFLSWTSVSGPYFRAGPYFEYRESRAALAARKYFRLRSPAVLALTPPEPGVAFHLEPGAAVLNWPLNYVGYTLEATTDLSPPVQWTPLDGPYANTNGVFEYRRALPGPPQEFYRLRWP